MGLLPYCKCGACHYQEHGGQMNLPDKSNISTTQFHSFHWHVQNATIPCCSQEVLPVLSVIYPPFFFKFAFISFNPCFTAWVCHAFTMCFLLLIYITYALSQLHLLSDLILLCLIFLELILKLFEDGSQEACGANGVYMVLKKQWRWDRFECRWAVGLQ